MNSVAIVGRGKVSRKTIYGVIVFVVLVIIVLGLTWRNSANGQQTLIEPETPASQLLAQMAQTLQARDVRVSYQLVGRVENVSDSANILLSGPQYYVFLSGNGYEMFYLDSIDDRTRDLLLREIEFEISVGDMVFSLNVNDQSIQVVMAMDGSRYGGTFLMLSRIDSENPDDQHSEERGCEQKVLSTDLFGRPAEQARGCCRATCLGGSVQECELESVESKSWYFGYVDLNPNSMDVPRSGIVRGSTCRAYVSYVWGVRLRLPEWSYDIPGPGGEGNLIPNARCRK